MPGSERDLVPSHEGVRNDTSGLSKMKISDEHGAVEKRTVTVIEKNGCRDSVYINAAKIFQGIHNKKPKDRMLVRYGNDSVSPLLTLKDECSQRLSYELAFSALKYQDLLEEMLLDSCAYPCHLIPDELTSLLVVMLYDLQDRKFEAREISDEEEPIAEVRKVEHFLYSFRIKLAAALARCRIKNDALSIEYVVPETIRKHEQRASALPLCVWINTCKTSPEDVFEDLENKGFTEVKSVPDLTGYTYCMDQHCHDVLFFPSSLKDELLNSDLLADCKLLLQDKSRSLAVHSVQALLSTDDADIIVAHLGSHLTITHMAALRSQSTSRVFVCGVKSAAKAAELRDLFSQMECYNIQLLHEDFIEIGPKDPRLQNAKVILLIPQCSGLGFSNPIDFILSEHGDVGLLKDLFQGSVPKDKLSILAERQFNELMHAMKFKVQSIVYCTSSVYPEENELVVNKALASHVEGKKLKPFSTFLSCTGSVPGLMSQVTEEHRENVGKAISSFLTDALQSGKSDTLEHWPLTIADRLIPPVLPGCSDPESCTDFFFKIEPSEISSGCFLAVIAREEDSSAKDVLPHTVAEGLLDSILGKSKEEQMQQKVAQCESDITATEPKIAEFPHLEGIPRMNAAVSVAKGIRKLKKLKKLKKKKVKQATSHVQLKQAINPVSDTGLPKVPKHTAAGKVHRRQTLARKARAERRKMLAVKPVEIIFPPEITPYARPQRSQPKTPAHNSCSDCTGAKSARDRVPPPPVSKVGKPTGRRNAPPSLQCSWMSFQGANVLLHQQRELPPVHQTDTAASLNQ